MKGLAADRIAIDIEKLCAVCADVKYSGCAVVRLFDIESNHKGTMSRSSHLSELMRLRLKSHDFVGLEAYIARFESLCLLLAGTKEAPSETLLLTALDNIEAPLKVANLVTADFAAFRRASPNTPEGSIAHLVKLLKEACVRERFRKSRSRLAAVVQPQPKPEPRPPSAANALAAAQALAAAHASANALAAQKGKGKGKSSG